MGRLRNRDQPGSRYQDDVGYNPMGRSFTKGAESCEEHEEHKGGNERNTRGNEEETLKRT